MGQGERTYITPLGIKRFVVRNPKQGSFGKLRHVLTAIVLSPTF
jgi:hypothetical protein